MSPFVTLNNDLGPPKSFSLPLLSSTNFLSPAPPPPAQTGPKKQRAKCHKLEMPSPICWPQVCVRAGIFDPISEKEEAEGQSEFPKCQMLSKCCLMLVHAMPAAVLSSGSHPRFCCPCGVFRRAHSARLDHGQDQKSPLELTKNPPKSRDSDGFLWVDFNLFKTFLAIKACFPFNEYPCQPPPVRMATSTSPTREMTTVLLRTILATGFDWR